MITRQVVADGCNVLGVGLDVLVVHLDRVVGVVVTTFAVGLDKFPVVTDPIGKGDQELVAVDVEDCRLAVNDGGGDGTCLCEVLGGRVKGGRGGDGRVSRP